MDVIAKNKKAFYEYFINDTLEAGIALNGDEVKSLREGKVSINEAFAETDNGELINLTQIFRIIKKSSKILISDEKRKESYWLRKKILIPFKEK